MTVRKRSGGRLQRAKIVMAVSGALLAGFVVFHMAGNLKIYQGPDAYNEYSAWLHGLGYPLVPRDGLLWVARVGLTLASLAHLWAMIVVVRTHSQRGGKLAYRRRTAAHTYISRAMPLTGVWLLAFIGFHLADFTLGVVNPVGGEDIYRNVVSSLSRPFAAGFYITGNLALGLHLAHGISSAFASLGAAGQLKWRRRFAYLLSTALVVGNISIPMSVLTGVIS